MAFAANSSAFGIKPSGSVGAFGQPPQPSSSNPSPFTGFGVPSSQPPAQQPSIFGTSTQGQNTAQPQSQNNQAAPGSLFGQPAPQQAQPPGGLFGGNTWGSGPTNLGNPSTQPTQSSFGNWGQPANQSQNQTQQQPQTGFNAGGSIFGNPGGQQQSQPGGNLWGGTSAPNAGQSIFGQPSSAPAPSQQQQQQPTPSFTRTTKFNDLSEQVQKTLEAIDVHIQGRIQISNDLKVRSLDEEPTKGAELIRKVHNDLVNTMSTLQSDEAVVEELRSKVDQSVQDTIIATRITDGFRNPQQNGAYLKNHANFPLEFFTRAAEDIRQKLQWYKTTIEQIERKLASVQNQVQYNPYAITATIQTQNSTFITLAGKTAELNTELQKVKAQYRELWRAHTGSARDPFNEIDRRSGDGGGLLNGLGSLNLSR